MRSGKSRRPVTDLLTLMVCMLAYLVFKACEYRLIHLLSDTYSEEDVP